MEAVDEAGYELLELTICPLTLEEAGSDELAALLLTGELNPELENT